MNFFRTGWGIFTILMILTALVSVITAVIENAVYKMRQSEYKKYNGRFSGILKDSDRPFPCEKKERRTFLVTAPIIMIWVMTGVAALILVMKRFYIINILGMAAILLFTFPALLIALSVFMVIVSCIITLFVSSRVGINRTILNIRKKYKTED